MLNVKWDSFLPQLFEKKSAESFHQRNQRFRQASENRGSLDKDQDDGRSKVLGAKC